MTGVVEFLPAEFDPEHDHAPVEQPPLPRPSWQVWAARGAAAIVATAAVAVWVGTRHESAPPSGAAAALTSVAAPRPAAIGPPRQAGAGEPEMTTRSLATAVSPSLAQAIRAWLPHVRFDASSAAMCTRGPDQELVYVSARAHYGAFVIDVVVQQRRRHALDTTPPPATAAGTLLGSVHRESAGSTVEVDAYARSDSVAWPPLLEDLADDLSLNFAL